MSLYRDAAAGTLNEVTLNDYLKACGINEQSKQRGGGTFGFTPLALAARNGHAAAVSLLLSHGAHADGLSSSNRTPLWLVTARGQGDNRANIVDLLLKHGADPKYSHPELQGGSTPLENELKQLKDLHVVRLLVDKKGVTQKATELAAELGDSNINDVMQSTEERTKSRDNAVNLIFGFIQWGINTAGVLGVNGIVNRAVKSFQFTRNRENAIGKRIAEEIPAPRSKEDFQKSAQAFIEKHKLNKFFPPSDSALLDKLISKALDIQNDDTSPMGQSANTEELVKFSLYQTILYCDDSASMSPASNDKRENRISDQRDLVRRITKICTELSPEDCFVHLRFINTDLPNLDNLRTVDISNRMRLVRPNTFTEIGTNLRKKILEPFVYNTTMKRPLFISIITDGVPSGGEGSPEHRNTLRDEILNCQDFLLTHGLPPRAVVFQISQIGSDEKSKEFLQTLTTDPNLRGVYITTQQLDSKFRELRGNEWDLESWLFRLLLSPVLGIRPR
ncbi:ankyrin repeat protein [Stachybotrys elegans]|uniref:Ankyrin repeat protein n=1 Tax=Stachybotrys elegans TaxID=80388 RepID=A0A8K0SEK2_9HYPO|nr:ankyrin repeat protein [Stachybotrys elegans]